jgi:hypothetical protein
MIWFHFERPFFECEPHDANGEPSTRKRDINGAKLNECRAYSNFIMGTSSSHFT